MSELLQDVPLDQRGVELVETIRSSSGSLLSIINEMLDFSKSEASRGGGLVWRGETKAPLIAPAEKNGTKYFWFDIRRSKTSSR